MKVGMRMSDDTISRKATIDAIEGVDWYHIDSDGQLTHGANSKEDEPLYKAEDVYTVLNTMPSAQPKKRTEERTETHGVCLDTISRKAAIDAILAVTGNSSVRELYEHVQEHGLSDMWSGGVNAAIDIIIAVPPAPQRTGRWKKVNGKINCSACNHCSWSRSFEDTVKGFNFCPNCGADMREGEA